MPNATSKSVAHDITNPTFVRPVEAFMYSSSGIWNIPYTSVSIVSANTTHVSITDTGDLTSYNAYVTLYYTKSI